MEELSREAVTSEIVHRLHQARRAQQRTQQEVYDATGVHVGRLESQQANLTLRTLITLARYYGISLADLFQGL